jgi:hypothetical protein
METKLSDILIQENIERLSKNYIEVFGEEYYIKNLKDFLIEETNKFFINEIFAEKGIHVLFGSGEPKSSLWKEENPELSAIKEALGNTSKDVKLMILKTEDLFFVKELVKLTIKNPNFLLISADDINQENMFDNRFSDSIVLNNTFKEIQSRLDKMEKERNSFIIKERTDTYDKNLLINNKKFSSTKEKIENMRRFRK